MAKTTVSYKWSDRKRIIFGLPWTFTKYAATDEKLLIRTGVLNVKEEGGAFVQDSGFDSEKDIVPAIMGARNDPCLLSG